VRLALITPGAGRSLGNMIGASARKRAQSTRERADFLIMSLAEPGRCGIRTRIVDQGETVTK